MGRGSEKLEEKGYLQEQHRAVMRLGPPSSSALLKSTLDSGVWSADRTTSDPVQSRHHANIHAALTVAAPCC